VDTSKKHYKQENCEAVEEFLVQTHQQDQLDG